ncbi:Fungal specific transcription factor domain-containing protein [Pleurostoma richardsiae]|uniref:Fungal specific transcription factor domain-containing protein n=1 Tax=Pleurostoma richardsiae TaxID=41990 RepID=A0AA38RND1_9PEZI|nr:Fungal specific transcription factor domain-containing protein [Pleurostoma richardsiae]
MSSLLAQHSAAPPLEGGVPDRVSSPIKPSRKQVSRACDWCRARRIKCDDERPCRACQQKGVRCVIRGSDEPRTLVQALREIDRLRLLVKELEIELETCRKSDRTAAAVSAPSPSQSTTTGTPSNTVPCPNSQSGSTPTALSSASPTQWEGIFVATARSDQTSYYGPSSAFYFVSRIGAYLGRALQQPFCDRNLQPRGVNRTLVNPTSVANAEPGADSVLRPACPSMTRAQEEYFLNTFWESHYCCMPIINEDEFRRHYDSLWSPSQPARKDSALVDIILALCIQCSYALIPRDTSLSSGRRGPDNDATIAGRWYYKRCQSLLATDLESPSIITVQCQIFSTVYLCCASFQNMAHITLSQAVRVAEILGLHLEPPASMPRGERELRKRIWWVLYTIEAKTCTKLGRPFSVNASQVNVTLPSDDIEVASLNGATLGSHGEDVTWLTYALQCQKLILTSSEIYNAAWDEYDKILASGCFTSPYKNPESLERCAEFLATQISRLQGWVAQVPAGLRTKRRGGGQPFSLDRSPLDIETLAPMWLQRQRLYLEITYHTVAINLYRPFISFYHNSGTYTPTAERYACACVNHAIAQVLIMHQAVNETELLGGWQEYFLWHWNATVTIIGFLLAYPIHISTANARKALEKSIQICDIFGANFGVAASAASIARDLMAKVDLLISRVGSGVFAEDQTTADPERMDALLSADDGLEWLEPGHPDSPGYFSEFMDWALTVDAFNSFEHFYETTDLQSPSGNIVDEAQIGS